MQEHVSVWRNSLPNNSDDDSDDDWNTDSDDSSSSEDEDEAVELEVVDQIPVWKW
jgi:hypothetical protein